MERPRAILCIWAHLEATRPLVITDSYPATIHDFSGFPRALYEIRYPAPGDPELAQQVINRLQQAGYDATAFDKWLADTVATGAIDQLVDYRCQAPRADYNPPYPAEHFPPLLVAAEAAAETPAGLACSADLPMVSFLWPPTAGNDRYHHRPTEGVSSSQTKPVQRIENTSA